MMSVVVLLMGNRTDPALAAKATPKSNRFTTVSSKPDSDEACGRHSRLGFLLGNLKKERFFGNVAEDAKKPTQDSCDRLV